MSARTSPTEAYEKIPTVIFADAPEAAAALAAEVRDLILARRAAGRPAVLGLATGSTPVPFYRELIRLHREEGLSFHDVITFNLDEYYEDCVIGGTGAFMIPIKDRENFVRATKTKLIMEIAEPLTIDDGKPSIMRTQQREPRVSCTVGENMWRERWGR